MRSVTLKNWFLLASISCGVGFGSTFLISRNLQQSAWAGLGTVPAVAASMTILSRQRKEEIDRQVDKLRSLEGQERLAREQLQLTQNNHRQIDRQVRELRGKQDQSSTILVELAQIEARKQSAIDSVQQSELKLQRIHEEIDRHSAKKEQLESRVANLHNQLTSLRTEISETEIRRVEIEQQISRLANRQNQLSIAVAEKSDLELQGIHEEISQQSARRDQLEVRVADLHNQLTSLRSKISETEIRRIEIEQQISRSENRQNQLLTEVDDLDRSIQDRKILLEDLDLGRITALEIEISSLLLRKQEHQVSLDELERILDGKRTSISELKTTFTSRQGQLDRIVNELTEIEARRQSAINSTEQLELVSQRIQAKIYQYSTTKEELGLEVARAQAQITEREAYRTEIERRITRLEEELNRNTSLLEDRDRDSIQNTIIEPLISWEANFLSDPHLPILRHINQHSVITESEIRNILKNSYFSSQFPIKIAKYNKNKYLPFKIKIGESDSSGSRYLKESKEDEYLARLIPVDIIPLASSQIEIVEPQLDLIKTEKDIFELEEIPTPALIYDDNLRLDKKDPILDLANNCNQENWEDYFQRDPLLPILRYINENGRILREQVYQMLRILGLNNQFSENINEYNTNSMLPFFILTEEQSNGNCIYIKGIRNADS